MVDIAKQQDTRGVFLDEVGVTGLQLPIAVKEKDNKRDVQYTIGTFNAFVDLPDNIKGSHMSRLVEVLYNNRENVNQAGLKKATAELRKKLDASSSRIEVAFPYFVDRLSPVSELPNLMVNTARFTAILNDEYKFQLGVDVKVGSYCPCAKEETHNVATHAQRGLIKVDVQVDSNSDEWVWIEDLIGIAEQAGSAPLYARLKRPDEAQLVLNGFNNPKFTEDITRDVAVALQKINTITGFLVSCENFEGIHAHNAFSKTHMNWAEE